MLNICHLPISSVRTFQRSASTVAPPMDRRMANLQKEVQWVIPAREMSNEYTFRNGETLPFSVARKDQEVSCFLHSRMTGDFTPDRLSNHVTEQSCKKDTEDRLGLAGIKADLVTYTSLLQRSARANALVVGKLIHEHIIRSGLERNNVLGRLLVNVYGKCGALDDAEALHAKMPVSDVALLNLFLREYALQGKGQVALEFFDRILQTGVMPNKVTFLYILSVCGSQTTLAEGKRLHARILVSELNVDVILATALLNMYGKCGSLENSKWMFDEIPVRDVVSWTAMIAIYVQYGHAKDAFELFEEMEREAVMPNKVTFVNVVKACASQADVAEGKRIHGCVLNCGFESYIAVGNALINMYGKCGNLEDAERTFATMPNRDVATWNSIITAYQQQSQGTEALYLFAEMQQEGIIPDKVTFLGILAACASHLVLSVGEWVHKLILDSELESDITLGNALVNMYGRCGSQEGAQRVFDRMPEQNVISWNAMITVYAQNEKHEEVLRQANQMQHEGFMKDKVTCVLVLTACASQVMLSAGKQMHVSLLNCRFESDIVVGNATVNMYGKCGSLGDAHKVFDQMRIRDYFSWSAMIAVFTQHGKGEDALQLFQQMLHEGFMPGEVTFVSIFSACAASLGILDEGKRMHARVLASGIDSDGTVGNALVNMYGKCGSLRNAQAMFNEMSELNIVSWNAMIAVYVCHGLGKDALHLFDRMQREAMLPDRVTFVSTLAACASKVASVDGRRMHARILDREVDSGAVLGHALVTMYGKCSHIEDAREIFDGMIKQGAVSWNVMIALYAQHGEGTEAIQLFYQMQQGGEMPNEVTFVSVLSACTSQGALIDGMRVHAYVWKTGFETEIAVENALVDMYGKCGSIADAQKMFDKMSLRDVVSWTSMIAVYAQHGLAQEALCIFHKMQKIGVLPNEVTFLSILSACSHAGLVDEGGHCFGFIGQNHGVSPVLDHYVCMIDLLGRAGRLDEAEDLIRNMPFSPTMVSFMALLGACRYQADVERGERAAKKVLELDPENSAAYIMLSTTYVAAGKGERQQT